MVDTIIKTGDLLLAKPVSTMEEQYKRSAILILETEFDMVAGLILNKPSTLVISNALPDIEDDVTPLYFGGVMNLETISYLHSLPKLPDSTKIMDHLYWGGSYDDLVLELKKNPVSKFDIKFCAGFTSWTYEQFIEEFNEGRWMIKKTKSEEVLHCDDLWKEKLLSEGSFYASIELPDPELN